MSVWSAALQKAIAAEKELPFVLLNLATIGIDSLPKVRSCVFRGWLFEDPESNVLLVATDARSEKCNELQANSHYEANLYLTEARQQYRVAGEARLVGDAGAVGEEGGSQGIPRAKWDAERERVWKTLSPAMQGSFDGYGNFVLLLLFSDAVDKLDLRQMRRWVYKRAGSTSGWSETEVDM